MAAPTAPMLGGVQKDVSLDEAVFGAEVKPHLVHEAVRAELNARRQGTRAAKSRGLVSGGRSKPWRQKGTGRARQGTIRAPQFTGGGVAFPPSPRSFELKVNRKAARAALRAALSDHAAAGTLGLVAADSFGGPSTKRAAELLAGWVRELPLLVVAHEDEEALIKSFRNLDRVLVTVPAELEVAQVVWARSLLLSEAALPLVERRALAAGSVAGEAADAQPEDRAPAAPTGSAQ
jgi:large subunit ribosomal protein L4